jgi:hypothetical protein
VTDVAATEGLIEPIPSAPDAAEVEAAAPDAAPAEAAVRAEAPDQVVLEHPPGSLHQRIVDELVDSEQPLTASASSSPRCQTFQEIPSKAGFGER